MASTTLPTTTARSKAVGQALANIDIGLERVHNMRSYAGELLNRADRITGDRKSAPSSWKATVRGQRISI